MKKPRWLTDDDIAELEVSQTRLANIIKKRRGYFCGNLRRAREFIIYALEALDEADVDAAMVGTTQYIEPRRDQFEGMVRVKR